MFKGSIVALATPFRDGEVDEVSYQEIIEWQISEGTDGLVPVGTTGESPTLSHEEHKRVVELCIEAADRRVPVIAGAGSNSTEEAVFLTQFAKDAGADGALIVTPYYNKPSQEGLYSHFKTIADTVDIPIIIYNIPGRSIVDMSIETMIKLSKITNVIGVKDATNDLFRPLLTRTKIKKDFCYLSGEDGTVLAYLAQGGNGCISVTANVAPKLCSNLQKAWRDKDILKAQEINVKLANLHNVLFSETSPGPVKYAASLIGLCSSETRLPLVEIKESTKIDVSDCLKDLSLI